MTLWITGQITRAFALARSKREDQRGAELLEYIAMGGLAVLAIVALFALIQKEVFPVLSQFLQDKFK